MNWNEFKNIFADAEIVNEKIVIKSDLVKVLSFIKENYHFEILKEIGGKVVKKKNKIISLLKKVLT